MPYESISVKFETKQKLKQLKEPMQRWDDLFLELINIAIKFQQEQKKKEEEQKDGSA